MANLINPAVEIMRDGIERGYPMQSIRDSIQRFEMRREMEVQQLEWLTGRDRLDLAVNGYGNPDSPLNRNG